MDDANELSVVAHTEQTEVRDIGFQDCAIRAVVRHQGEQAGMLRSATLHWSEPTSWSVDDEGHRVSGALQFHQVELPTDLDTLRKVRDILIDMVQYVGQQRSEVGNTTAEETDGNDIPSPD